MYKSNRIQAAHSLNKLSATFLLKEKMYKAQGATGKKRAIEEDDDDSPSSVSSGSPPGDDDDDDDD